MDNGYHRKYERDHRVKTFAFESTTTLSSETSFAGPRAWRSMYKKL
jgi:hypothetical protein